MPTEVTQDDGQLTLVTAATAEPVSLPEVKRYARVDSPADDNTLTEMAKSARAQVEDDTGAKLISQQWRLNLQGFPGGFRFDEVIELPYWPLISVDSVKYVDWNGDTQTVAAADYEVSTHGRAQIRPSYGNYWPSARGDWNSVQVLFTVGYASASVVPQRFKQAIFTLVNHDYYAVEEDVPRAYHTLVQQLSENWDI